MPVYDNDFVGPIEPGSYRESSGLEPYVEQDTIAKAGNITGFILDTIGDISETYSKVKHNLKPARTNESDLSIPANVAKTPGQDDPFNPGQVIKANLLPIALIGGGMLLLIVLAKR